MVTEAQIDAAPVEILAAAVMVRLGYWTPDTGIWGDWTDTSGHPLWWRKYLQRHIWGWPSGPYEHPVYADVADEAGTAAGLSRNQDESDISYLRRSAKVFRTWDLSS